MSESIGKIKYETEEEMRARIEAEVRAKIEAEVKAKIEAEVREKMLAEERSKLESETVVSMPSADMAAGKRFARPYVEDHKLAAALDKAFDKLELYYPEGKVFALNSIDKDLCERISDLYKRAGYATVDDMLKEYGFKAISGAEVKGLRSFVMYSPGNEPDCIKGKVKNVLKLLEEYYPERVIRGGLESDHKSLAGKISGLYQWFGYEDRKSFLSAYGYDYVIEDDYNKGHPAQDFKPIIDALVEKYKNEPKPKNIGALLFENPEIKGKLKTLQNKSNELFGMSLKKYFEKLGILEVKAVENAVENASAPSKSQICDDARDELIARYVELDKNKFGTIEDALNCLKGMNVKLNKSGKVYIFRAGECDSAVTIPYGIDSISNKSFMNQQNLKEVVISASLTEIPSETFYGCPLLERIEIPEGVLSIGEKAFAGCVSLKEITLPESLQKIKSDAFVNCRALETVNMLNPMTLISDGAFAGCPFKYELPEEPEATDIKYFEYSIDSKKNVTITGFSGNQEKVVIPSRIEGYPVRTIKKGAFQNCKYLTDLEMPDTITTMQGNAFKDCISLKRIHLSNSISKIITTSLNGCIGLKEINIPDCVTEIKRATFEDAPLEKLHIGKGLASICSDAFYAGKYDPYTGKRLNSRDINKVTIDSDNPYLKVIDSMVISKDGKILYAVLRNKKSVDIPEGIETICEYALEGLVLLSDVSLPDSLVTIGKGAFARTSIRSITFGDNVKKIGKGAFSYCQNLTAVVFNDGLEEIETNAFINSPIISIYLPSSLRVLGVQSFDCLSGYYGGYYYGDGNRQELLIDSSNPYLKTDGKALYTTSENKKTLQCLYRCQINEYTVQDGTTHIGNGAFHKCSNLSRIVLPEGLISIGQDAFANCSRITDVQLPQSIETIEKNAFRGTMLRKLVLGANVKDIGPGALITGNEWENKRPTLRNIKVDKANPYYYINKKALMVKKSDGTSAVFMYFGGDETVIIPDGISEIAEGAFTRSIIQEIQIPSSVTVIGEKAFFGCAKLARLKVGFAEPENGVDIAVVYIPEIKRGRYNYEDTQIRNQYMDCIRVDGSGSIFDFVKYDSLFETITTTKDKILIATDRLKSAIQLVPLYKDKYFSYLRRNAKKAVEIVVEYDDLDGLNTLAELNIFTGKNIDRIIEVANKAGKSEILSYLMNYKNSNIGIKETDYDL